MLKSTPLVLFLNLTLAAGSLSGAPLRVLYFSKSSGFEHSVVKRVDGQPSFSEKLLAGLAVKHDLVFTFSKDGSLFTPDYLAQFDVIMFFTSGYLGRVGMDGQPAITAEGKQALLDAVAAGKGFVGLHSASDTYHTFEVGLSDPTPARRGDRFRSHGAEVDAYIRMLGGEFIRHGKQQSARVRVVDPQFPGCGTFGDNFTCLEEWYSLKDFTADLHVLLVLETSGMTGAEYERPDFPLAWAKLHGKGRVWFNAMGHREDVWESERFQAMLIGGIEWAGRRRDADITPNLRIVAPGFETMPPKVSRLVPVVVK